MKKLLLFALAALMTLAASAQGISVSFKNEPLSNVFKILEKQAGCSIICNGNVNLSEANVTASFSNASLSDILKNVIKAPLKYEIKGNIVVISTNGEAVQARDRRKGGENKEITITGKVTDKAGSPLIGAVIWVKDTQFATTSDIDGKYSLSVKGNYGYINISLMGYKEQEKSIAHGRQLIDVVLEEDSTVLEEAVAIGYGHQKKASIVGAISTIDPEALKVPVAKISNALAGRLSGVISYKRSGEPGQSSTFFIRGVGTFGENSKPLVLVDGVERSLDLVDVEDIKEFSILKDAAATAVYGVRGANGVILVTTRNGEEGRAKITGKFEYGFLSPTKVPEVADGMSFVRMFNEASGYKYFSDEFIEGVRTGSDPDLYPNVNWTEEIFRKNASTQRASVNVSGGTSVIKYYVSLGYYNENGMFKVDPSFAYNTSMYYRKFNFRSNLDINLTKHTRMNINLANAFESKNQCGTDASTIWYHCLTVPAVAVPVRYSTGELSCPGGADAGENPYGLATQTGYRQNFANNAQSVVGVTHDFDWCAPGLKFNMKASFDVNQNTYQNRTRTPEAYFKPWRDEQGNLHLVKFGEGSQTLNFNYGSSGWRSVYFEASLTYNRSFGKHGLGALFLYQQSQTNYTGNSATNSQAALPYRHQGIAFRTTYNYDSRYFFEFNAGYNGSENFSPGHRFGFFPSVALGWMVSNESFWEPVKNVISQLKFKGSYGLVGNDQIGGGRRFIYLETISKNFTSVAFGATPHYDSATRLGDYANPNVGWETSRKLDVGADIQLFNALSFQLDYFQEYRDGIFLERLAIPLYMGVINQPWVNIGKMRNSGFDASMKMDKKFGDWKVSALANYTFARNVILDMDEPKPDEPYMAGTGQARWETLGYVANGLFKDMNDIATSPDQSYFGEIQPGDIKYVDLNNDGVINASDRKPMGYTSVPEIVYGFGASVGWKGFDLSVFFQGVGNIRFSVLSSLTCPFIKTAMSASNILTDVVDNYWTPERPYASYPRLTRGAVTNNNQTSTFWLRDGKYLRLKNAEFGYSLPTKVTRKMKLSNLRFYLSGDNLLCFSPFKLWDPDQNVNDGATQYPTNRTISLGVNVSF